MTKDQTATPGGETRARLRVAQALLGVLALGAAVVMVVVFCNHCLADSFGTAGTWAAIMAALIASTIAMEALQVSRGQLAHAKLASLIDTEIETRKRAIEAAAGYLTAVEELRRVIGSTDESIRSGVRADTDPENEGDSLLIFTAGPESDFARIQRDALTARMALVRTLPELGLTGLAATGGTALGAIFRDMVSSVDELRKQLKAVQVRAERAEADFDRDYAGPTLYRELTEAYPASVREIILGEMPLDRDAVEDVVRSRVWPLAQ